MTKGNIKISGFTISSKNYEKIRIEYSIVRKTVPVSAATKKKISDTNKRLGRKPPSAKGLKRTAEFKNKISIKNKIKSRGNKNRRGKKCSEETKILIRNKRKLQIFTLETRMKMSLSGKGGHKYWLGKHHSKETCEKISKANKGRIKTEEERKNISKAHIGKKRKPFSDEVKKRMSESQKKQWAKRKENKI
jgi:hypothetical protein